MQVIVNQKPIEISETHSLSDLIQVLELKSSSGIAIALDQNIIPKSDWERTILKANQHIQIITASQGG
ncbi:MAG: sulfur carrier protein ThiS [Flavobacteriales bacterium]